MCACRDLKKTRLKLLCIPDFTWGTNTAMSRPDPKRATSLRKNTFCGAMLGRCEAETKACYSRFGRSPLRQRQHARDRRTFDLSPSLSICIYKWHGPRLLPNQKGKGSACWFGGVGGEGGEENRPSDPFLPPPLPPSPPPAQHHSAPKCAGPETQQPGQLGSGRRLWRRGPSRRKGQSRSVTWLPRDLSAPHWRTLRPKQWRRKRRRGGGRSGCRSLPRDILLPPVLTLGNLNIIPRALRSGTPGIWQPLVRCLPCPGFSGKFEFSRR